ncbi:MAG: DegT/DnrJ/EryC1/StrS family aminotransferase [Gemmatimonadaceae bacterium]
MNTNGIVSGPRLPGWRHGPAWSSRDARDARGLRHGLRGRFQLPVFSPLPASAIRHGLYRALRPSVDCRRDLAVLLRRKYDADVAILCAGGTQALELAIRAARRLVGERAPVALPAFTCFDVATAAVGAGAAIALYDIDPVTLAPDADSLERVLAAGARIVVVSHLYGVPVPWDAVTACATRRGAIVIEDAAQGHGGAWRSRPLGALGDITALSFGRGKGWTGVKGGALLLRSSGTALVEGNDEPSTTGLTEECRILVSAVAQLALGRPGVYAMPRALPWLGLGETQYRDPTPARGIAALAAALVGITLPDAETEAGIRRSNASHYQLALAGRRAQHFAAPAGSIAGYLRYPVRMKGGIDGLGPIEQSLRLGIAPGYPAPLDSLASVRARMRAPAVDIAGARMLARDLITLPTHSLLSITDRERVLQVLDTHA